MFDPSQYIGDFTYRFATVTILGAAPQQLVAANPNRVGLLFANDTGNVIGLLLQAVGSMGNANILFGTGSTYELYWARHALLVTLPWWGISLTTGVNVTITELIYHPGVGGCGP